MLVITSIVLILKIVLFLKLLYIFTILIILILMVINIIIHYHSWLVYSTCFYSHLFKLKQEHCSYGNIVHWTNICILRETITFALFYTE